MKFDRTALVLAALLICGIVFGQPFASAVWVNAVTVQLLRAATANMPRRSPLLGIGLRHAANPPLDVPDRTEELYNVNWNVPADPAPGAGELDHFLDTLPAFAANNFVLLSVSARLDLLEGHLERARHHLNAALAISDCAVLETDRRRCYYLWTAMGDLMDRLGDSKSALDYYRVTNWFGRKEAGATLALNLADEAQASGQVSKAKEWRGLARQLLPGTLAVEYAYDPDAPGLGELEHPMTLLGLDTDPRLEKRTAEAVDAMRRSGQWSHQTFERVLGIRAWMVDTHTLDYGEYDSPWRWTAAQSPDPDRVNALQTFFERLAELAPQESSIAVGLQEYQARRRSTRPGAEPPGAPGIIDHRDMEAWWSYGQPVGLVAALVDSGATMPGHGWVWGPDTLERVQGSAALRAECLSDSGSKNAGASGLRLVLVHSGSGQVQSYPLDPQQDIMVDYWWKATGALALEPALLVRDEGGLKKAAPGTVDDRSVDGWTHTALTITPQTGQESLEVNWFIRGCGTFWLDDITLSQKAR